MPKLAILLAAILVVVNARPSADSAIAAPNCHPGQEYNNGKCREVFYEDVAPSEVMVTQQNCRIGEAYINGRCIIVWRNINVNTAAVPSKCPAGQEFVNDQCRNIWHGSDRTSKLLNVVTSSFHLESTNTKRDADEELKPETANKNIISVPNQCPSGYKPDNLGICRPIFD